MRIDIDNNKTDYGEIGCMILIGLVLLPFILKKLLPYFMIGLAVFFGYKLYLFAEQNGYLAELFDNMFADNSDIPMLSNEDFIRLEKVKENLTDQLQNMGKERKAQKKQGQRVEKGW